MTDSLSKMQRLLLQIPKGKITTYKALAEAMGTKGYRFVGQLLHKNPLPDKYPCYKVVGSDGRIGGYALGNEEKINRLRADGLVIEGDRIVGFKDVLFTYRP